MYMPLQEWRAGSIRSWPQQGLPSMGLLNGIKLNPGNSARKHFTSCSFSSASTEQVAYIRAPPGLTCVEQERSNRD
jgi:hypothetical protein